MLPQPPSPATTVDSLLRAVARIEPRTVAPPPPIAVGEVVGETYELIERVGGGGMGVVYRALDRRLGRDVAVKIPRPTDAEDRRDRRRLFEREARATAQLLHPNIVTLHHVGIHADTPFLVLELLAGETLAARLARKGKLALGEALAILDAVLAALSFAHERGVLHRDLKPTNVFVTVDERVKVLDFGVAVSLDTDPGPITRHAGTPGYMAPEQRDGETQGAQTDVWAAGVLLLECLTGRRRDQVGTLDVDRGAATTGEAARLDGVPAAVLRAIERAMLPDPAQRTRSAALLRAELAAAVAPAPGARGRRRLAVAAACAVALAAGATAAWIARGALAPDPALAVGAAAPPAVAGAPPTPGELRGLWNGAFGTMYLEVSDDGAVRGAYQHDDGLIQGRYADGVMTVWWCELPSRRGATDAGAMELRPVREARGLRIDGRWKYGGDASTPWHDNGDLTPYGDAVDRDLERQLMWRATTTCPDPEP
jgi:hypothetical protein